MNIEKNISLKAFNTFGIKVVAEYFGRFKSTEELAVFFNTYSIAANSAKDPVILGGGSNILFTQNIPGCVLKNEIGGTSVIKEDIDHVYLEVGAGENWHKFVMYCLENNYAGVENLALIPGNIGASPMQNIGAYGVEIQDVFHSLQAFDCVEKCIVTFSKSDCAFGYRESIFKNKYKGRFIIITVTYKLNKKPVINTTYGAIVQELEAMQVNKPTIQDVAAAVIRIRTSKLPDPAVIGNAGSFFKNPEVDQTAYDKLKSGFPGIVGYPLETGKVKLAAGWLIEQCGWKGYRKGDAGCHAKQALVLVNYGHASGNEVYELSSMVMESVYNRFGIRLEREVNII